MKTKRTLALVMMLLLCLVQTASAFYNPSAGRWLNRDPIEEKGGRNPSCLVGNDAPNRTDYLGLAPTQNNPSAWDMSLDDDHYGPGKGPNGKTWLTASIIIRDVNIHNGDEKALGPQCRCCVTEAVYDYTIHLRFSSAFQSTLDHETQHGLADEQLAITALPYAIDYLKSRKNCKMRVRAWTRADCLSAQQGEANAAVAEVITFTMGIMNVQAHAFFGDSPATWNPNGIEPYFQWLDGWFAQTFSPPAHKFW